MDSRFRGDDGPEYSGQTQSCHPPRRRGSIPGRSQNAILHTGSFGPCNRRSGLAWCERPCHKPASGVIPVREEAQVRYLIRFEWFEVNLRSGELSKGGEKVKLPEQSFQILAMLLERPGEVVFRHEIQKRLWPNDTVVEFENSINAAIKRLRSALGDSADQPRYIETLARRGYRFICPIQDAGPFLVSADGVDMGGPTHQADVKAGLASPLPSRPVPVP